VSGDVAKRRLEFTRAQFLDGRRLKCGEAGRALGRHPSSLRYAAPTAEW
jgi:hypothetical protein